MFGIHQINDKHCNRKRFYGKTKLNIGHFSRKMAIKEFLLSNNDTLTILFFFTIYGISQGSQYNIQNLVLLKRQTLAQNYCHALYYVNQQQTEKIILLI